MATTELTVTEVPLPHMASMETATLTTWSKQVGETVAEGETICEVTTEKVDTEIESPASGVVAAHLYEVGVELALGTVVALLVPPGLDAADVQAAVAAYTGGDAPSEPAAPAAPPVAEAPSAPATNGAAAPRLLASPLAKRLAKEHGIDLVSLTGTGSRGKITRDDVLKAVDARTAAPAPRTGSGSGTRAGGARRAGRERRHPARVRGTAGRAHQALERAPRHGGEPDAFVADDAPAHARDPDRPLDHRESPA